MKKYSRPIFRWGIALVFLWFGINQVVMPSDFMGYLPDGILNSDIAVHAVVANGIFEIVFGLLLLVGLFTRIVSAILFIHLLIIAISLGYSDIMIRDIGLAIATFSITLGGKDIWSLDNWLHNRKY
jgi:uncharacterized membrane protein YphA (DoxX/SURF4 family)